MKKYIPNTITSLNLLSGAAAIVAALLYRQPIWAMGFIALSAVFDLFDGLSARLLHVKSDIGADLDSLADVISFGLAPAVLVFSLVLPSAYTVPCSTCLEEIISANSLALPDQQISLLFSPVLLIAVFAAVRLAKFNNDKRQQNSFIGLPVPANALFWVGFVAIQLRYQMLPVYSDICTSVMVLYPLILLFCYLMISEIPMFSFKIKGFAWRGNESRYLFLVASIIFLVIWGIGGLAPGVLLYVLIAVASKFSKQ